MNRTLKGVLQKMPGYPAARLVHDRLLGGRRETADQEVPVTLRAQPDSAHRPAGLINRMELYASLFDGVTPWSGDVPKGYLVDFSGALTDAEFRTMFGVDPATTGGGPVETRLPVMGDGEGWFEAANWVLAAREAKNRFVMITLGA